MKASRLRKITEESHYISFDKILNRIHFKGRCGEFYYNVYEKMTDDTINQLKLLGYTVKKLGWWHPANYYISWNKE